MGRGHLVNRGEAVGVIAAQSIGEPGTGRPCVPSASVVLHREPLLWITFRSRTVVKSPA
ncbi:hypothetical protein [Marinobacterium stanieri]|uniref:hypothetical protein n=1 Tax=Marinobacterium stanieri TaxID=49186 RepID=UPI003A8CE2EE